MGRKGTSLMIRVALPTFDLAVPRQRILREREPPTRSAGGERFDETKAAHARDALAVAGVVGDQHAACLATRDGDQDIVAERFADALELQSLAPDEVGQNHARFLPSTPRRRHNPRAPRINGQNMAFEHPPIGCAAGSSNELLCHDRTQVLERGEA